MRPFVVYGKVVDIDMRYDEDSAIVVFQTSSAARNAMESAQGKRLYKEKLHILCLNIN